jgi:hypothetical protein
MQPHEQLILGIAASLIFWALMRWTPLLRDLLAALAVAGLIYPFIRDQVQSGFSSDVPLDRMLREVLNYPHFFLGLAVATTVVLALLHAFRVR